MYQTVTEKKTTMGVILCLFLGLIGLLIGIIIYPSGSLERKTFMKGWLTTFLISLAVEIILGLVIFFTFFNVIF